MAENVHPSTAVELEAFAIESGTLNVVQSLQELKSGTLDVTKTVQTVDELKSGTLDVLSRVDSIDELKSGTVDVVQSLQELKSGTLDVTKTVQTVDELKSGTIVQTGRDWSEGTIESNKLPPGGTIGPLSLNPAKLGNLTVGVNTDIGINVNHELNIGNQYVVDGSDTIPTEGIIMLFNNKFTDIRMVRTDLAGTATVTATYLRRS